MTRYRGLLVLPTSGYGGAEIAATEIAACLSELNEIEIVALVPNNPVNADLGLVRAGLQDRGVRIVPTPASDSDLLDEELLEVALSMYEADFLLIVVPSPENAKAPLEFALRNEIPFLLNFQLVSSGFRASKELAFLLAENERRGIGRIIFLSESNRLRLLPDILLRSVELVPNGVSQTRLEQIEASAQWVKRNPNLITFVGRLHRQKGVDVLVRAFALALEVRPNLRLRIVGSGEMELQLKNLVQSLGLNASVDFVPFSDNPVIEILHAALTVVPSRFEGADPILLQEALAAKAPLLVSNIAEHGRVAALGLARVFRVDDAEDLAAEILLSFSNSWLFTWMRRMLDGYQPRTFHDAANSYQRLVEAVCEPRISADLPGIEGAPGVKSRILDSKTSECNQPPSWETVMSAPSGPVVAFLMSENAAYVARNGSFKRQVQLINQYLNQGCQVIVVLAEEKGPTAPEVLEELGQLSVKTVAWDASGKPGATSANAALRQILERIKPDLIHFNYVESFRRYRSVITEDARVVLDLHDIDLDRRFLVTRLESQMPKGASIYSAPMNDGAAEIGGLSGAANQSELSQYLADVPESIEMLAISKPDYSRLRGVGRVNVTWLPFWDSALINQAVPPENRAKRIVFVGGLNAVNAQAFARIELGLLPRIRKELLITNYEFLSIGRTSEYFNDSRIPSWSAPAKNFYAELSRSEALIFPLQIGTGQNIKIAESLALGIPVFTFFGLASANLLVHGENAMLSHSIEEMADQVREFIRSKERRTELLERTLEWAAEYKWQTAGFSVRSVDRA